MGTVYKFKSHDTHCPTRFERISEDRRHLALQWTKDAPQVRGEGIETTFLTLPFITCGHVKVGRQMIARYQQG